MPELKRTFLKGRMNQDLDERLLPNGEYFDATNIQVSTSEGSDVGAIESVLGNTRQGKRSSSQDWALTFGFDNPVCIGGLKDNQNNKIYWFLVGGSNGESAILEYDESDSIVRVVIADVRTGDNQVLGFSTSNLITGANIIDGMLFFTDNLNEPRKINIRTFLLSPTNTGSSQNIDTTTTLLSKKTNTQIAFTAEDINVIKKAPKQTAGIAVASSLIGNGKMPGTGVNPITTEPISFNSSGFPVTANQTLNLNQSILPSLYINRDMELRANIRESDGSRRKYIVKGTISAATTTSITFTPDVVPQNIPTTTVPWEAVVLEDDFIYKREFPRFSYRWKYSDGEYSSIAPFTEPIFLAGEYKYENMDAENEAMLNHIRKITLTFPERLSTYGPPRDVEFVEVLYKSTKSNSIYVVKTAQLKTKDTVGVGENPPFANFITLDGEFDKLEITSELDGPIIDSSQLLRLFDAVPKKALAQEIIANRIVYGNYTEGYDEPDDAPSFNISLSDIRNTATGTSPVLSGIRSLKSDKTYQIGVSYLDEFNRESPVLTNNSAVLKVSKGLSFLANRINVSLNNSAPSWAKFFKYYIKDNYSTEYNLLLDRFYDAGDGGFWLSFPSAERNKISEKDILVLKKKHGEHIPVIFDNEYKVVDIKNEAPESLKLNNLAPRARAKVKPVDSTDIVNTDTKTMVQFKGPTRANNEPFSVIANKARAVQFVNPNLGGSAEKDITSQIYKIKSSGHSGAADQYKFILEKEVSDADFSYLSQLDDETNDRVEVILYEADEVLSMEYQGRFFVKIENRASFHEDVIAPSFKNIANVHVSFSTPKNAAKGIALPPAEIPGQTFIGNPINEVPAFVEDLDRSSVTEVTEFRGFDNPTMAGVPSSALYNTKTVAQMAFDDGSGDLSGDNPGSGSDDFTLIYGPTNADIDNVSETYSAIQIGAQIRFRNGNTFSGVYSVTGVTPAGTKTTSGRNYPHKLITLDRNYADEIAAANIDGIQVVTSSPSNISIVNPAIFEVKPEKNIDLDIYYEASSAFDISEINNNKALKYGNCISFGNGVESTRISDDFNAPEIGKGVRVSSILKKPFKEITRQSDLIFSGIVNSKSDVNNSNQFLLAENITKSLNPIHGSLQKLHARDGDLIALCEDKCFRILADKDALFNADGNANLTASSRVLGQAVPFTGEFGISKNPESFVSYGFRAYFTDKSRGAVLRLSRDGLTEISSKGMSDFIEDKFKSTSNSLNGSYDESSSAYNLRIDNEQISYAEANNGWTTRLTYRPEFALSLNNTYYSFNTGSMWKHDNATRCNFYGAQSTTTVTAIFNDAPSSIKNFKTIFYEGDQDWTVALETDKQTGVTRGTINPDLEGRNTLQFYEREGKYYNFIGGDALSWTNSSQSGNLDIAESSTQGIGNATAYVDGIPAKISFSVNATLPDSIQIGDTLFYVDVSEANEIYKLGEIAEVVDTSTEKFVRVTKVTSDVPGNLPATDDFVFFVKDPRANTSGIIGYFNKATFTNTGTNKNELFAVGTEVLISS